MSEKMFIDVRWTQRGIPTIWQSTFCSMGDYLEFINQDYVIKLSHTVRRFAEDSKGW
jgi:hypothetical protein